MGGGDLVPELLQNSLFEYVYVNEYKQTAQGGEESQDGKDVVVYPVLYSFWEPSNHLVLLCVLLIVLKKCKLL